MGIPCVESLRIIFVTLYIWEYSSVWIYCDTSKLLITAGCTVPVSGHQVLDGKYVVKERVLFNSDSILNESNIDKKLILIFHSVNKILVLSKCLQIKLLEMYVWLKRIYASFTLDITMTQLQFYIKRLLMQNNFNIWCEKEKRTEAQG